METEWTLAAVEARLVEASWTMARLPDRELGWLRVGSQWPDTVKDRHTDYAEQSLEAAANTLARRTQATRREVEAMEEALAWLKWIESPLDRKLVFCAGLSRKGAARDWKVNAPTPTPVQKMDWDNVKHLIRTLTSVEYPGHRRTLARNYRAALRSILGHLITKDSREQLQQSA